MAKIKEEMAEKEVIPTKIEKLSVDFLREDLNNVVVKINEIIDALNDKIAYENV